MMKVLVLSECFKHGFTHIMWLDSEFAIAQFDLSVSTLMHMKASMVTNAKLTSRSSHCRTNGWACHLPMALSASFIPVSKTVGPSIFVGTDSNRSIFSTDMMIIQTGTHIQEMFASILRIARISDDDGNQFQTHPHWEKNVFHTLYHDIPEYRHEFKVIAQWQSFFNLTE